MPGVTRDPRSDPAPGDRLSLGGTVRHVTSREADRVAWEVEQLGSRGSSSLTLWRAHMRSMGGVALEPGAPREATPAAPAAALSPRALLVLAVLADYATGAGGRVEARCRGQLADTAGCSLPAWKRWVCVLLSSGYLERVESSRWELGLRVTDAGRAAAAAAHPVAHCGSVSRTTHRVVSREVSRGEPPSTSSLSLVAANISEEEREDVLGGSVSRGEPGARGSVSREVSRASEPGRGAYVVTIAGPDAETVRRLLCDLAGAALHAQPSNVATAAPAGPMAASPPHAAAQETNQPVCAPPAAAHVAWAQLREAWLTECGLPASKCSALDNRAWLDLCSRPGAPPIDPLLVVLRREAPKWHAAASEAKQRGDLDVWARVPSVRTWLGKRPWELAPDPSPRAAGERPTASPEVTAYVEELRRKADRAQRVGDHALAQDYRRGVDRALATGAVP